MSLKRPAPGILRKQQEPKQMKFRKIPEAMKPFKNMQDVIRYSETLWRGTGLAAVDCSITIHMGSIQGGLKPEHYSQYITWRANNGLPSLELPQDPYQEMSFRDTDE